MGLMATFDDSHRRSTGEFGSVHIDTATACERMFGRQLWTLVVPFGTLRRVTAGGIGTQWRKRNEGTDRVLDLSLE